MADNENKHNRTAPGGAPPRRFVVGISGATGAIYGIRLLQILKSAPNVETHLIMSKAAERTVTFETDMTVKEVQALALQAYGASNTSNTSSTPGERS